jgi:hypothetical protein
MVDPLSGNSWYKLVGRFIKNVRVVGDRDRVEIIFGAWHPIQAA